MSRITRHWPSILLAATLVGLGWNVYYRAVVSEKQRSDFVMLHAAGRAVLDGTDIYEVRHPRGWPFYYPPTMAAAMAPLAVLSLGPAVLVWYGINVVSLLWVGRRLVQVCDEIAERPIGPWVVAALLVNFGPIAISLQRGQVTLVLLALMVEAFWCYRRGSSVWCGVWIALATALKVYPGLLILPLLMRRDGRGLVGFGAGLFLFLWLVPVLVMGSDAGMTATREWVGGILIPFFTDAGYAERKVFSEFNQFAANNQSLFGVGARWLCGGSLPEHEPFALSVADLPTAAARAFSAIVSLALVAVMAVVALQKRPRNGIGEAIVWALPMAAANLISHVGWHHYFVTSSVLYALAITAILRTKPGRSRGGIVISLGGSVVSNWLHLAFLICRQIGFLMWGTLLLWAVLARMAWREGRKIT